KPYPDTPVAGEMIAGLTSSGSDGAQVGKAGASEAGAAKVFHAGTALDAEGNVVSAGGRVLCVAALGDSVADAQRNAYAVVDTISWASEFHRHDIGWRAIARERG